MVVGINAASPDTSPNITKSCESSSSEESKYKALDKLTQKYHALNHLRDAITHVGGIQSLYVREYEASQKQFKA